MPLLQELKRRNVIRMAGLYLVGAWLMIQVAATLLPAFDAPPWLFRSLVALIALGIVPTLLFSWIYELTPEGLKRDAGAAAEPAIGRDTGRRIDRAIIVVLLLALGYFAADKFVLAPRREAARAPQLAAPPPLSEEREGSRSIAVLPFADMSAEHDQEYFSDGIAEELLNRLSQFPDLRVAARTSAFQFKGKNLDIAQIGRQLKVVHVLEGSVRKSGARVRITAQLINSESGFHLWSQTYERDLTDVFQVQDEIASAIAGALEAKLGGRGTTRPPAAVNPEAYDAYLKGRAYFARRVGENLKLAVAEFDRAIALDPKFSPAHSGRAFALAVSGSWVPWMSDEQAFSLGTASAEEALRLDPDNPEAYVARGVIHLLRLQIVDSRADFERALALAPENVDVLNFYGDFLESVADLPGAERVKRKAMALDPLAFVHPMNLSNILADQGRYRESLEMAERALAMGLTNPRGRSTEMSMHLSLGELDAARASLDQLCQLEGAAFECTYGAVLLLAKSGRRDEALREAEKLVPLVQESPFEAAERRSALASLYANQLGDIHKATALMRESMREVNWGLQVPLTDGQSAARLPEEISRDPEWLALWNDPTLKELMDEYVVNLSAFRKSQGAKTGT